MDRSSTAPNRTPSERHLDRFPNLSRSATSTTHEILSAVTLVDELAPEVTCQADRRFIQQTTQQTQPFVTGRARSWERSERVPNYSR